MSISHVGSRVKKIIKIFIIVIAGDLNLRLKDMSSSDASNFRVIADQFGLIQHVAGPTHRGGGWLDVIITRDDCVPTDLCIHPPTDHGIVEITIPFLHDAPSYLARQVRGWRNLDREAFRSALLDVPAIVDPSILDDLLVADIFSIYEATMAGLIDRFLPAHPANVH